MPDASSAGPTNPPERLRTARLLQAHGIRPDRDFGQNFLLDENLVDLAVRLGGVGPEDVVLEVGPGVGTLTTALARVARRVHAVEIDRRLEPALEESLADHANVTLHWGDVMRLDVGSFTPPPTCFVANLPYNIATPLVMESLWTLPDCDRWAVMVQREVADRWTAAVGSALYGAPTVLLGLTVRQTALRPVPPTVFMPRPRVDSAIVAMERIAPAPDAGLRRMVQAAFAHRRKTLVNTLTSAGWARDRVIGALAEVDLPAAARAQELTPTRFTELFDVLGPAPAE